MELSKMSDFFDDILHMIGGKILVSLNEPLNAVRILKSFGKRIQRLEIIDRSETKSSKLEKYLRLIIKYCEKDKLTELHLDLGKRGPKCNKSIINESMAYFTKIKKLTIKTPLIFFDYEDFLISLSYTAKHLQHLKFSGGLLKGSWSQLSAMTNLIELRIHSSGMLFDDIDYKDFELFLESIPSLEVFDVTSRYGFAPIVETLVNHCPNLKVFGDRYTATPYMCSYNQIERFKHLREVTLSTYGNFQNIRQSVANISNKLEKFELFYSSAYSEHFRISDGFNAYSYNWLHSAEINLNFTHRWEYLEIKNILESFNGEKRSCIRSMRIGVIDFDNSYASNNSSVINLIELTPKLEQLDIVCCIRTCSCSKNIDIHSFIQCIRYTLKQLSNTENVKPMIRLILNQKTWNEIQNVQIEDLKRKVSIEMLPY